jgi:hypothetical protein
MQTPLNRIGEKQLAEKQHLSHEQNQNAECSTLALVLNVRP